MAYLEQVKVAFACVVELLDKPTPPKAAWEWREQGCSGCVQAHGDEAGLVDKGQLKFNCIVKPSIHTHNGGWSGIRFSGERTCLERMVVAERTAEKAVACAEKHGFALF